MRLLRISVLSSDRLNLHFDQGLSLSVSPQSLTSLALIRNMEISPRLYRRIYLRSLAFLAYQYCLRLIALSSQARPIIFQKLNRYFYLQSRKSTQRLSPELRQRLIKRIIKKLEKNSLIDDRQYILNFISRKKQLSHYQLVARLQFLGFDHILINELLSNDESQERDKIRSLIQKKIRHLTGPSIDRVARQKLLAYLSRRSFDYDDIKSVVDEFHKKK